jgi:hypothetical protein
MGRAREARLEILRNGPGKRGDRRAWRSLISNAGAHHASPPTQSDDLEARTEAAIATCDGDARAAVRALAVMDRYVRLSS